MNSLRPVPSGHWRFGPFELDALTRTLRKHGLQLRLSEQPARILEALLERRGELVSREELRERLWPVDTFVDFERSLNAAVAKLRQVLTDSAEQPRYIETVARRGYRFVAPVESRLPTQDVAAPVDSSAARDGVSASSRRSLNWVWAAAAMMLLVVASAIIIQVAPRGASDTGPSAKFVVVPPDATTIHPMSAISADGSMLAFVAVDKAGRRTLWLRELASDTAARLDKTDDAALPFFSADSKRIGFFAEGRLKTLSISGGAPEVLCKVSEPAGGTWSRDNTIMFSQAGRLYKVSARGGAPTELSRPPVATGQTTIDTWPQFLPDGRRFIVSAATHNGHINALRTEVLLGTIDSGKRTFLVNSRSRAAITASGYLLFRRDDTLVAQALDASREHLVGEPRAIAQELNPGSGGILVEVVPGLPNGVVPAPFSVSDNGVLVYHSKPPVRRRLIWFDREGKELGTTGEYRDYTQMFLSPDEQSAVLSIRNLSSRTNWNLWLLHLKTNVLSRLTFGNGRDADPAWQPNSDRIVYGSYRADQGENIDLMELSLADRVPKRMYADGYSNKPEAWSPDGRLLLFRRNEQTVYGLAASGDLKPVTVLETPVIKQGFRFSPDGRWLAYASMVSGRPEIYISSYPGLKSTMQVSTDGGFTPAWRKDGKELFYMSLLGDVMSVNVTAATSLDVASPKLLFRTGNRFPTMPQFVVTENGRKFLVIEPPPERAERMVVMTHWDSLVQH